MGHKTEHSPWDSGPFPLGPQEPDETALHLAVRSVDRTSLHIVDFLVQNRWVLRRWGAFGFVPWCFRGRRLVLAHCVRCGRGAGISPGLSINYRTGKVPRVWGAGATLQKPGVREETPLTRPAQLPVGCRGPGETPGPWRADCPWPPPGVEWPISRLRHTSTFPG